MCVIMLHEDKQKIMLLKKTLRHIVISYLGTFKISLDSIASLLVYTSNILIMILAFKVNNAYPNEAMSIIQLISRTINHTMQVIVRDGTTVIHSDIRYIV